MTQGVEHIPTEDSRKLVKNLSAMGTRYVDIAHKLEITDDTLRKHYKAELEELYFSKLKRVMWAQLYFG
jgi:hypothetical protein